MAEPSRLNPVTDCAQEQTVKIGISGAGALGLRDRRHAGRGRPEVWLINRIARACRRDQPPAA